MNIFEQAKDAGFIVTGGRIESPYIGGSDIGQRLIEFAALVRAEALEEAEEIAKTIGGSFAEEFLAAIRGMK